MSAKCDSCIQLNECRWQFGKYWEAKSNGGKGCANPLNIDLPKFAAAMELARKNAEREEASETTIQTEIDF